MNVRSQFKYYIYTNRSYLDSRQLCILNRLYSSRKKRMWILQLNCWCGSISGQHSFTHFEYSGQFILYIFFIVVNWFPFGIGWNDDSHETNDATRFFFRIQNHSNWWNSRSFNYDISFERENAEILLTFWIDSIMQKSQKKFNYHLKRVEWLQSYDFRNLSFRSVSFSLFYSDISHYSHTNRCRYKCAVTLTVFNRLNAFNQLD